MTTPGFGHGFAAFDELKYNNDNPPQRQPRQAKLGGPQHNSPHPLARQPQQTAPHRRNNHIDTSSRQ
jgi:hypothetical protein